jgi:hypothetical protein
MPQLRDWHEKYKKAGLTIVGVHSPEFFWEKPLAKVKEATARLMIKFPVVQDNDSIFGSATASGPGRLESWSTGKAWFATAMSARALTRKPSQSSNSCSRKQVDRQSLVRDRT